MCRKRGSGVREIEITRGSCIMRNFSYVESFDVKRDRAAMRVPYTLDSPLALSVPLAGTPCVHIYLDWLLLTHREPSVYALRSYSRQKFTEPR